MPRSSATTRPSTCAGTPVARPRACSLAATAGPTPASIARDASPDGERTGVTAALRATWRSVDDHHRVDLEVGALRQAGHFDGGTGRVRRLEVVLHDRVDLGKFAQIGQVQAQTHDLVQRTAGGFGHGLEVVEGATGLGFDVTGADDVVHKVKEVFASLYNDRAIAYRVHHGFKHEDVFLSAGVQLMVRSGVGSSGVLFTLDTESGFRDVVFVTSSFGLGEMVVQGAVNPDEYYVYTPTLQAGKPAILRRSLGSKAIRMVYSDVPGERVRIEDTPAELRNTFSISDEDVQELSKQALVIEKHYGRPMDIEWAKDGVSGKLSSASR
ncbi:hypothetical protein G6F57_016704 [Rhizopus arrhizus]|nr:hypothetical protein G6F57_016704 [Rhizopus arrhizus]